MSVCVCTAFVIGAPCELTPVWQPALHTTAIVLFLLLAWLLKVHYQIRRMRAACRVAAAASAFSAKTNKTLSHTHTYVYTYIVHTQTHTQVSKETECTQSTKVVYLAAVELTHLHLPVVFCSQHSSSTLHTHTRKYSQPFPSPSSLRGRPMHRAVPKMQAENGSINGNETFNYSKLTSKFLSLELYLPARVSCRLEVGLPDNLLLRLIR